MIANHGQEVKYHHKVIGCNSRLDTLQAAVLEIKLRHLDEYCQARYSAAAYYSERLKAFDPKEEHVLTPHEVSNSTHVYHQYTLRVNDGKRDALKQYLADHGVPSMIYYPLPLQEQEAFMPITRAGEVLDNARECANTVLSLPIHTELTKEAQDYIIKQVINFFK